MENKNYKGLVWLVVILIVLIVALMGFIVYREFYSEEKPSVDNIINTTAKVEENNENTITSIENFPKENSDGIKSYLLYEQIFGNSIPDNFDEKTFFVDDIKFNAVCVDKEDNTGDNIEECVGLNYYLGSNKLGYLDLIHERTQIIITDDNIIIQSGAGMITDGDIKIFDKTGKLLKTLTKSYQTYLDEGYTHTIDTTIKVVNNNLYYITSNGTSSDLEDITFKCLNLNNLTEKTIETIKGYILSQE